MSNELADKLDEARKLVERGWIQGEASDGEGYCALGACGEVIGTGDAGAGFFDLREMLQKATGARHVSLWNDRPERTQAEVVAAFKRAAELARSA